MSVTIELEPVYMQATDHRYFPKRFVWRGRMRVVDAVEQCWTVRRQHWQARIERHGFRVRSGNELLVLYHDLSRRQWYVERKPETK